MTNDILTLKEIVLEKLKEGDSPEDLAVKYNLHPSLVKEWKDSLRIRPKSPDIPVSFEEQVNYLESKVLEADDFEEAQTMLIKVKAWQIIQAEKREANTKASPTGDSIIKQIETKRC